MRYVSLIILGLGLLISSSGFAESIFDNATITRCRAANNDLTVCAVLQGQRGPLNFPMTANNDGDLFIPFFVNGQRNVERSPQSVTRQVVALYQRLIQNNRPFNPNDPEAFRDASHRQTGEKVVSRNGGAVTPAPIPDLKDATVTRCLSGSPAVRTLCARVNNRLFLISGDEDGKVKVNVNGQRVAAPKDLVDKTLRFYQDMFDKHFAGKGFDPNSDDAFRDQAHKDFAAKVVSANTGFTPGPGVKFAPPVETVPPDGNNGGGNNGGHDNAGGNGGEPQPIQRPTFEASQGLFEQRKARFLSSESTRKPDIEALKKAISETGSGGLTFVRQQCVYPGNNSLYERTLALGLKSDGTIFAAVLPKDKEGKVSLAQLESGGVRMAENDTYPPPSLRGTRTASDLGPASQTTLSVRSYQEEGKTKYLVRMAQESGADDENPVIAYCAAKSGNEATPVTWQDTNKPTTARMANLLSTVCAKCHGLNSNRKVKFNPDGTIALQPGQTRAGVNDQIARRVAATSSDMMPPPTKISESDRDKLRLLVKTWAENVPRNN